MNYLAHGLRFLGDPYLLAGTAVPDWLSVVDRQARVRRRNALLFTNDEEMEVAAIARGIVQHHDDDAWFHACDEFNDLCWQLTLLCRDALPDDVGFRPSFLGHVLSELLIDAELAFDQPSVLDLYYSAISAADMKVVTRAVWKMAPKPPQSLSWFIDRFCEVQFLRDYSDDAKLAYRFNQVLSRVGLRSLPDEFIDVIPLARIAVSSAMGSLKPRIMGKFV